MYLEERKLAQGHCFVVQDGLSGTGRECTIAGHLPLLWQPLDYTVNIEIKALIKVIQASENSSYGKLSCS